MRIAIFGRSFDKSCLPHVKQIFDTLLQRGSEIFVVEPLNHFFKKSDFEHKYTTFEGTEDFPDIEYAISIGGDGTLLEAVTTIGKRAIPVLAINAGRLGFMATVPIDKTENALDLFFEKKFKISERILVQVDSENNLFDEVNYGLNECAILKRDSSSMIVIHTYINGEFLNSYWADGLIVSTPTGSTGYSLSCGGPLVMPATNNFIIAPVNPHNLNVRPLVVPDDSEITFNIEGRSKSFLVALDHRSKKVSAEQELKVSKANFKAQLIELDGFSYFNVLRNKLNWGLDARN